MTLTASSELILLRAFVATAAALIGGLMGVSVRNVAHSTLCGMVSLAAGALLAVTVTHILPETVEMAGFPLAAASTGLGLLAFFLVGKYVYYTCPACAATATEKGQGYLRLGILLIVTLALHSTMDGLAIAAGYEHEGSVLGIMILLAVSYHKVPEGLALVAVCRLSGWSRMRSLVTVTLVELTTALGAVLGMWVLGGASEVLLGCTLGFVAGSFLYTVGFATLKEMLEHERGSIILYAVLGAVSIVVLHFALAGLSPHL